MKQEAHDYANLFPMMTQQELEALAADIKENGLRHPIVRYNGVVLDGRNRLRACEMAGVKPTFSEYDGDDAGALALVISLNVQRRDLTAAQRAIVAAKSIAPFEEAATKRRLTGKSVDGEAGGRGKKKEPVSGSQTQFRSTVEVGKMFKVHKDSVQQAKALLAESPDLAGQVEACTTSLKAAWDDLQRRRAEAQQKQRDAAKVAEFKDAISSGEMNLDDALQKAIQQEREEKEKALHEAQARELWDEQMQSIHKQLKDWVGDITDNHLAWYTEAGSPGSDIQTTPRQIRDCIAWLKRVLTITFQSEE